MTLGFVPMSADLRGDKEIRELLLNPVIAGPMGFTGFLTQLLLVSICILSCLI